MSKGLSVAIGLPVMLFVAAFVYMAYANKQAEKVARTICASAVAGHAISETQAFANSRYPNIRFGEYDGHIVYTAGGFGMYRAYCTVAVSHNTVESSVVSLVYE
jgi:hypothetical protein